MYGSFRLSADETDGRLLEGLRFYGRDVQREAPCVQPVHLFSRIMLRFAITMLMLPADMFGCLVSWVCCTPS